MNTMFEPQLAFSQAYTKRTTTVATARRRRRRNQPLSLGWKGRPFSTSPSWRSSPLSSLSQPEQEYCSFWVATTTGEGAALTPATTFEPVLNLPALVATAIVLIGAFLLRLRQDAIAGAAQTRMGALSQLRSVKTKELSNDASPEEVQIAVEAYETALQQEEQLRTLLPGVRLRAPNNPQRSEQDLQAVRQFLGSDAAKTFVNEANNNKDKADKDGGSGSTPTRIMSDEEKDEIGFSLGPFLGLCALFFLLLSPQFLAIFLDESDTKEVLDILGSANP